MTGAVTGAVTGAAAGLRNEEDGVIGRTPGDRDEVNLPVGPGTNPDEALGVDPGVDPRVDPGVDPGVDLRHEGDVFRRPAARAHPRRTWDVLATIALGGGAGSVARHLVGQALPASPAGFPWGTFTANVTGGFALGALMVFVLDVRPPHRYVRPFLGVGVLGGYTTFSTFTTEIVDRASRGAWFTAGGYAAGSMAAGLAAIWCGIVLARVVARAPVRRCGRAGA